MPSRATTPSTERSHWPVNIVHAGMMVLVFGILFWLGHSGRTAAVFHGHIEEARSLRSRLLEVLDADAAAGSPFLSGGRPPTNQLAATPAFQNLLGVLKIAVQRAEDSRAARRVPTHVLELRLSQASIALAERRFADALATVTEADETSAGAGAITNRSLLQGVLRVRADALFGQQRWGEAAPRYQRLLDLDPNRIEPKARLADCFWASGNTAQGYVVHAEVAQAHRARGDQLLLREQIEPALEHYQTSSSIFARLLQQESRPDVAIGWSKSTERFGDGLVLLGNPSAAIASYEGAIEMRNRMLANDPQPELRSELAAIFLNRGDAFLVQGRFDRATNDYATASNYWASLAEMHGPVYETGVARSMKHHADALAILKQVDAAVVFYNRAVELQSKAISNAAPVFSDLALTLNNRGGVQQLGTNRTAAGAATADFSRAIDYLQSALESEKNPLPPGSDVSPELHLDVITSSGFEHETEVTARTRSFPRAQRADLSVILSLAFKNRGFARLEQNEARPALDDFQNSAELLARLVENEGRFDLGLQYAKSLLPAAMLMASSSDDSIRNAGQAREMALKACEQSDWMFHPALDVLAAAFAEAGIFAEARKWQARAIELAPPKFRAEYEARSRLYQADKPYRRPSAGVGAGRRS